MTDSAKALSRERFAEHASEYVTSESHAGGEDLVRLVELADPDPGWVALDVATGGGHTAIALAPRVARMVALDLTPEMLDAASAYAAERGVTGIEFVEGDAEHMPFDDEAFDLVTCRIAAHHFPDIERFAAEVLRVLKPGGRFVLQDQCVPASTGAGTYVNVFERLRDPSHVCALSEAGWTVTLQRAGFTVDVVERFDKRQVLKRWAARQSCDAATVAELGALLAESQGTIREWMAPEGDGDDTTFAIKHVVLRAHKA